MHSLEYLLALLAERIEKEFSSQKVAEEVRMLASSSHWYVPPEEGEPKELLELSKDWAAKYDRQARSD